MQNKIRLFISKFWFRIVFFIMGLGSLIWFLVRIVPKPSRAQYPCMKAAAPVAFSFISYVVGISVFAFLFKKAKQRFIQSKYIVAIVFVVIGLFAGALAIFNSSEKAVAHVLLVQLPANNPIGDAKGVFPGRVVWEYNPDATDENCTNESNDFWYFEKNTNQKVVDNMLSNAIQKLTGTTTDAAAWDLIFRYYNKTHNRGDVGYKAGEKIVIKINLNGEFGYSPREANVNTSPQICLSILKQLVNVAGVAQANIGIGDPNISMNDATFNRCSPTFPAVKYWGSGKGKTSAEPSANAEIFGSDGSFSDVLPQAYLDATYMINIPVLKKHHRAGISLCSKNHFGSIGAYTGGAFHLHPSLPCPNATGVEDNGEYGVYRCFVDIMGHKDLGGKTILFLVDGIWGSINWGHPPIKWTMTPFNGDWPSSLFLSLDPVAVEAVCLDFLYDEFDFNHPTEGEFIGDDIGPFPHFSGVDDYLYQAADPKQWAQGISYDPENDGTPLKSLGTYENWNNAIDKQYSRNLSASGTGIELFMSGVLSNKTIKDVDKSNLCSNYPNPFKESTTIRFQLETPSRVELSVYDLKGQKIAIVDLKELSAGTHQYEWNATKNSKQPMATGTYIYKLKIVNKNGNFQLSNKMTIRN